MKFRKTQEQSEHPRIINTVFEIKNNKSTSWREPRRRKKQRIRGRPTKVRPTTPGDKTHQVPSAIFLLVYFNCIKHWFVLRYFYTCKKWIGGGAGWEQRSDGDWKQSMHFPFPPSSRSYLSGRIGKVTYVHFFFLCVCVKRSRQCGEKISPAS